jgi:hypothetical protein
VVEKSVGVFNLAFGGWVEYGLRLRDVLLKLDRDVARKRVREGILVGRRILRVFAFHPLLRLGRNVLLKVYR